ncbi:hypothetical protein [Rhodococcus sp. NBC_00297]|uniref:hypothetical protein n=1 Tax=Rhodococcus sp. NBC_00297 TaxID=2976005 RepID=UPI002E2D1C9E|nr:hypothetical protein [Rhodococcus sp. NBC_00297]
MTSEPGRTTNFTPAVGVEVTVATPGLDRPEPGCIIDDFGDALLDAAATGRAWAPARRWAVALKSGRLVFADSGDLAPPGPR